MKIAYFLCSEISVVDQLTNRLSIINILEQINPSVFPTVLPSVSVIAGVWRGENDKDIESLELRIRLGPVDMGAFPVTVEFHGRSRNRTLINLQGIPVPTPGILEFMLTGEAIEPITWSIEVKGEPRVGPAQSGSVETQTPATVRMETKSSPSRQQRGKRK